MNNKKLIAKGLIVSILLFSTPTNAMADVSENYKVSVVNEKENKFEEFFNNLFDKFKKPKEKITVNKNIKTGTVKEVTLSDGQFVPNLDGNSGGYETIRVTTTGNKKLEKQDYDNLRNSKIPKIDLSGAKSDIIPNGAFTNASHLTEFKFPQGLKSIGDNTSEDGPFYGCDGLVGNLTIPETVTTIGNYAFWNCSGFNGELIIGNAVTEIGDYAFAGCNGFTGDLIIPDSVLTIGEYAFQACTGFSGDLIIGDAVTTIGNNAFYYCAGFKGNLSIGYSVTSIGESVFLFCNGFTGDIIIPNSLVELGSGSIDEFEYVERIIIKIDEGDSTTDYRRNVLENLPETEKTVIDLPYDFDTSGKWFENTGRTLSKPIVKNVVDGMETEIVGSTAETVSLYIPVPYNEEDIHILKDSQPYKLPSKNEEDKHIFVDTGSYEITLMTKLENLSVISFTIENNIFDEAEDLISQAEQSRNPEDIEAALEIVNQLPESSKKDELLGRLEALLPNDDVTSDKTSSNFDIYINSENSLSLSLETSSITFDDFSGIEDVEKLNAISFTVDSSLAYDIKAYLPNEIRGVKTESVMNKDILNIRKSDTLDYKTFTAINTPIILAEDELAGDNIRHSLDIKLKGDIPFEKDSYRATVKLEVQQK